MANQPEQITYPSGVYQIEAEDPVDGGVNAITNRPLLALANRTAWLKKHVDDLESGTLVVDIYAPKDSPALTGTPTAPTQAAGDNSTRVATTAFVQAAVNGQVSVSIAGASNTTLSAVQAGVSTVILTGAVTGNKAVIFPAQAGRWLVVNRATGSFTVTCKTPSGTGVVVSQGASVAVFCDGTNVSIEHTDFISPAFTGTPTTPTPDTSDSSQKVANTAFVRNVLASVGLGDNSLSPTIADFNDATVASGIYYVTTAAANNPIAGTSGLLIHKIYGGGGLQIFSVYGASRLLWRRRSTSAWAAWNALSNLDSPAFTGVPTAPTQASDDVSTRLATTAFLRNVMNLYGLGATNGGSAVVSAESIATLPAGFYYYGAGISPYSQNTYVMKMNFGTTRGFEIANFSNTNRIMARVSNADGSWQTPFELANLDSPTFTGTPRGPTAAANTNTTQLATTAFVMSQAATATPQPLGTAAVGNGTRYARENHVHAMPTLDSLANVSITGNADGKILRWNGTAWVCNTLAEAGIAPIASPAFSGNPTAPAPLQFATTTQLANAAWVQARGVQYSGITQRNTAGTLAGTAAHVGGIVHFWGSAVMGYTLPAAAAASIPVGGVIRIQNWGTQSLTLGTAGGDTMQATLNAGQVTTLTIPPDTYVDVRYYGTNIWILEGTGVDKLKSAWTTYFSGNVGYEKRPNGMIEQWGRFVTIGSASAAVDQAFPIQFPTACLAVSATIGVSTPDYDFNAEYRSCRQDISISVATLAGFEAQAFIDNFLAHSRVVQWRALGY